MMGFFPLVLIIGLLHSVSAVTHSLKYFYTGSTGMETFPEYVAVGIVDGKQIDYFDSVSKQNVLKQSWMEGARDEKMITDIRKGYIPVFSYRIRILMQRFNQTTGVHVVQNMYGCEWDDETGVTDGFDQHGYDGEDFIALDQKTETWIAPTQEAFITKLKWDKDTASTQGDIHYLTQECVDWLKKYVDYGRSSLMRTVPPSVSLLQKTPSSPVTCHATGFYPNRVTVTWKKDGQEQQDDVEIGESLPNSDGTFQKSVQLTVKPEEWKNHKYQCVVQVSGIKEDFIKGLTEDEIRGGPDTASNIVPIIGVLIALVVVSAVIIGVVIWKKKKSKNGFAKASSSDTDSDNSAQKT
ncbi:hypothetical protein DPEC_G00201310 [Dallia pectoralis]|uniref:Uncharacterized protein n=1 Tax=Dallia pectoralis TaxID=75939 RepID=A0ACC2G937_DALPE|nr:hypothetical protein DPEC_G00201310 [Dallia pectoralis]